jgi:signal transduction histidine kinase
MVKPIVSGGRVDGIFTLMYTNESGRRYDRDDPALVEELAVHAAEILETARLMTELKSSETRFRIALAGARTVVYEQDRDLRYTFYYNPVSRPHTSFVGKTQGQTLPPEEAKRLETIKKHVIDTGESAFEELDLTAPGDETRHFREAVEALRDREGRIVGIVGAATDITEQQRVQQQLTEALGFRERVMTILGHDLRNPLNVISIEAGVLLDRQDLDPDARNHLSRLRRAADRIGEMIGRLVDFAHARFLGQIPISRVPADLGQIGNAVCDELRVVWPDHNIEVEVRGDTRGEWDPARMGEVISNLIANGVIHGDPHTPVHVSIDGTGHDVVVKVKNQGVPIPADVLPLLFEPFRRGAPEDQSPRGLGLGLYIAREIVLAHEGTINVDSTAKEGTTVTVQLPRAPTSTTAVKNRDRPVVDST